MPFYYIQATVQAIILILEVASKSDGSSKEAMFQVSNTGSWEKASAS